MYSGSVSYRDELVIRVSYYELWGGGGVSNSVLNGQRIILELDFDLFFSEQKY